MPSTVKLADQIEIKATKCLVILLSFCLFLLDRHWRTVDLEGGSCSSSGQPMAAGPVTSPTFTTRRGEPTEKKP